MTDEVEEITFEAFIPSNQTAIQRHGGGQGMRVVLDIPENQMENALHLLVWIQRNLQVTIKALPKDPRF